MALFTRLKRQQPTSPLDARAVETRPQSSFAEPPPATLPEAPEPSTAELRDDPGRLPRGLDVAFEVEQQRIVFNRPQWITNDSLLRDEGVAFAMGHRGSGGTDPQAVAKKLDAIHGWYQVRATVVERRVEQLDQLLDDLDLERARLLATAKDARAESRELLDPEAERDGEFGRVVLRAAGLIAVALTFGALLVWWFAQGRDLGEATLLALGVWMIGNASVAPATTYLLTDEPELRRARWKQLVEEFGFPVAGGVLVLCFSYGSQPWPVTIGFALSATLLFAFVGRAALREVLRLPAQRALRKSLSAKQQTVDAERARLEAAAATAEQEVQSRLSPKLETLRADKHALGLRQASIAAESYRKQALFLSEYHLTLATPSFGTVEN